MARPRVPFLFGASRRGPSWLPAAARAAVCLGQPPHRTLMPLGRGTPSRSRLTDSQRLANGGADQVAGSFSSGLTDVIVIPKEHVFAIQHPHVLLGRIKPVRH